MARRKKPAYKQMAFETAIRNPERYKNILNVVKEFEGSILNDKCLLEIVSKLYLEGEVSSKEIEINEDTKIQDIAESVKKVNKTRKADGGFPGGYASRFWTYMRTMSELGIVYGQYNEEFKLSETAKMLLNGELDEQELFSIQAMKYNRKSPYRNVSNDFNYFRFIIMVLLELRKQNKQLSYEQFIVSLYSRDGDVDYFLKLIEENKFSDVNSTYKFLKEVYGENNRIQTVTRDYPDVVLRLLRITGFITLVYKGKIFIQINENKINYIKSLLNVRFQLTDKEKNNPLLFFNKLNSKNEEFINIVKKFRNEDKVEGNEYNKKLKNIIDMYNLNENVIVDYINNINSVRIAPEFKYIPAPLKLEFYISLLIFIKYGDRFFIRPNYKADKLGMPISHAPGDRGDIEVFSKDLYWLIEVTLIRNKSQQLNNETTSVIRHLLNHEAKSKSKNYLSFVAPYVHEDTVNYYRISIVDVRSKQQEMYLKPYSIGEFIDVTLKEENFKDMENYTVQVIREFKDQLL